MDPSRDEQIQDGDQLNRIKNELGPLARLLQRKKVDLFADWSRDEKLTKEFCKGALSVIDTLMSDIDQMIERAHELRQEEAEEEAREKELAAVQRSGSLDGGGYGDLAT